MSSEYVVAQMKTAISTYLAGLGTPEKLVELDGEFQELKDLMDANSIAEEEVWTGIQFLTGDENPITVGATNTSGKYREVGGIYIHTVGLAKLGGAGIIRARANALRDFLRGKRFGTIFIESMTTPDFSDGATLQFESGYTACSFLVSYQNDKDM